MLTNEDLCGFGSATLLHRKLKTNLELDSRLDSCLFWGGRLSSDYNEWRCWHILLWDGSRAASELEPACLSICQCDSLSVYLSVSVIARMSASLLVQTGWLSFPLCTCCTFIWFFVVVFIKFSGESSLCSKRDSGTILSVCVCVRVLVQHIWTYLL